MSNNPNKQVNIQRDSKSRNIYKVIYPSFKQNCKNNKENQINPKEVFKMVHKPEPFKEISKFDVIKENRKEIDLKKNLFKGNFFDDKNSYLSLRLDSIDLNLDYEDENVIGDFPSIKSNYSSINNIKSTYSSTRF